MKSDMESVMGVPAKGKKLPSLSFSSNRRFGVELEVNAFDKRSRPEGADRRPVGIEEIAKEVGKYCEQGVEIRGWEHTNGNEQWVVKPDSSCGLEIVTPPMKGWAGLLQVCKVVDGLARNPQIEADHRCSVHVHCEIVDLSDEQLATVLAYWIKCEPIFMDMVPPERKRNRYCQFIGLTSKFQHDSNLTPKQLIDELGDVKYYSANTNQYVKAIREGKKRPTMEVRIAEASGCTDAYLIKNWVRLLIHFIERTKDRPYPFPYKEDKPIIDNGLLWLDPEDVFTVLGFNDGQYELSKGLTQTRNWMLARLQRFLSPHTQPGQPRYHAWKEVQDMIARLKETGVEINPEHHLSPADLSSALYSEDTRY